MSDSGDSLDALLAWLIGESAIQGLRIPDSQEEKLSLMRVLMTVRPPRPVPDDVLMLQDEVLGARLEAAGIEEADDLPALPADAAPAASAGRIVLWQGDITRLRVDAIVNAANSQLLGCFVPLHPCIDNAIHSAAGMQLRNACEALMRGAPGGEPPGRARLTPAFNLPSRYVLHTVGPIVRGRPTEHDEATLASCYRACLELAGGLADVRSIAFCGISTGQFGFPHLAAARIAVATVTEWLGLHGSELDRVIFDVFSDQDHDDYARVLREHR